MAFPPNLQPQFDNWKHGYLLYNNKCEIYWEKKWNKEMTHLHFSLKLLEILYIT